MLLSCECGVLKLRKAALRDGDVMVGASPRGELLTEVRYGKPSRLQKSIKMAFCGDYIQLLLKLTL